MRRVAMRFGKFQVVGLLGAIVQLSILFALTRSIRIALATPIAVEIALLHNLIWHERFTWRDRRTGGLRQLAGRAWKFHAGNGIVSVAGNTILVSWLVERLQAPVLAAAIVAIAACSTINFLLADRWAFAEGHLAPSSAPRGRIEP